MKIISFVLFLFSISHTSISWSETAEFAIEKVDPDSIDPSMPSVIYHIAPKDLAIDSYRQGVPSHFSLVLCRRCQKKTYKLNPKAQLSTNQEPINKSDLALVVMRKEYNHITLTINRSTQSIDFLTLDAVKKSEIQSK